MLSLESVLHSKVAYLANWKALRLDGLFMFPKQRSRKILVLVVAKRNNQGSFPFD